MLSKGTHHRKRKLRTLIAISIIFLILGLGNILIGRTGARDYGALVLSSEMVPKPVISEDSLTVDPYLPHSSIDIGRKNSRLNHLKTRLDFYRIVTTGGKIFLAIGVLIALWALIPSKPSSAKITDEN